MTTTTDDIASSSSSAAMVASPRLYGEGNSILRYMNMIPSQDAIDSVLNDMKKGPKRLTHVYHIIMTIILVKA